METSIAVWLHAVFLRSLPLVVLMQKELTVIVAQNLHVSQTFLYSFEIG